VRGTRVVVRDPLPLFRVGAAVALAEDGLATGNDEDLRSWPNDGDVRVVLLTALSPEDWDLLHELALSGVLVVAVLEDPTDAATARAVRAGAVGVLDRGASPRAVREAVAGAVCGRVTLPLEVVAGLAAGAGPARAPGPRPAEADWLRALAQGTTVGALAESVGYSERVMFRKLNELYARLETHNRTQAIVRAPATWAGSEPESTTGRNGPGPTGECCGRVRRRGPARGARRPHLR
jgi:DNA-binding NarL/FixJ family response regulator